MYMLSLIYWNQYIQIINIRFFIGFLLEGARQSTGGVAYDYILKPATDNNLPRPVSPPKEKPITHDEIFKKLQAAEERRQVKFNLI